MHHQGRNDADVENISHEGVIPFQLDHNPSDLAVTTCSKKQVDGHGITNKTSMEVPVFPVDGSKSILLHVISQYDMAVTTMGWNDGLALYSNYDKQFECTNEWDVIANNHANTVNGFHDAVDV